MSADANGWVSIDSAPRDGTEVDIWADGRRFVYCFWYPEYKSWAYKHSYPTQTCVLHSTIPTHWRPLPHPPVNQGIDE